MDAVERFLSGMLVALFVFVLSLVLYNTYRNDLKADACKGMYMRTYSGDYVCIDVKELK